MYDYTVERVASLKHADLLARLPENMRLAEIAAERRRERRSLWKAARAGVAQVLRALALRIAPQRRCPAPGRRQRHDKPLTQKYAVRANRCSAGGRITECSLLVLS